MVGTNLKSVFNPKPPDKRCHSSSSSRRRHWKMMKIHIFIEKLEKLKYLLDLEHSIKVDDYKMKMIMFDGIPKAYREFQVKLDWALEAYENKLTL